MMTIPTYVGPSKIEGVGIFAAVPVQKNETIWVLDETFDRQFTAAQVEALGPVQQDFVERYGYAHMTQPGIIVVETDNGRFMNHSAAPNTQFTDPKTGWAIRDIAAGEELTCDYNQFDPSHRLQPGRTFGGA